MSEIPKAIASQAKERARSCCEHCGSGNALHMHHIVTRSRCGSSELRHSLDNIIVLCHKCHQNCHDGVEGYERYLKPMPKTAEERSALRDPLRKFLIDET